MKFRENIPPQSHLGQKNYQISKMSASKNQTKFTSPYSSLHVQKKKKKLKKKKD